MGRHFQCTGEIIVVSEGKKDIGKVPALGNDGKLDPSVIPEIQAVPGPAVAGRAELDGAIQATQTNYGVIPVKKVIFDQGNFFNGDGTIHIEQAGIYLIAGLIYFQYNGNQTGTAWLHVLRNDASILTAEKFPSAGAYGVVTSASGIFKLYQSDCIKLANIIGSPAQSINIQVSSAHLSIARLGD